MESCCACGVINGAKCLESRYRTSLIGHRGAYFMPLNGITKIDDANALIAAFGNERMISAS